MRLLRILFARWDRVTAAACGVAFVAALAAGEGAKSVAFLAAGLWWLLLSRYWTRRQRDARRHRELRGKRLERERKGLAPPRG